MVSVYCPECEWEQKIFDVTGEWPKHCPCDHEEMIGFVRTEIRLEAKSLEDVRTKTDKI